METIDYLSQVFSFPAYSINRTERERDYKNIHDSDLRLSSELSAGTDFRRQNLIRIFGSSELETPIIQVPYKCFHSLSATLDNIRRTMGQHVVFAAPLDAKCYNLVL